MLRQGPHGTLPHTHLRRSVIIVSVIMCSSICMCILSVISIMNMNMMYRLHKLSEDSITRGVSKLINFENVSEWGLGCPVWSPETLYNTPWEPPQGGLLGEWVPTEHAGESARRGSGYSRKGRQIKFSSTDKEVPLGRGAKSSSKCYSRGGLK